MPLVSPGSSVKLIVICFPGVACEAPPLPGASTGLEEAVWENRTNQYQNAMFSPGQMVAYHCQWPGKFANNALEYSITATCTKHANGTFGVVLAKPIDVAATCKLGKEGL
jgi:hypothetical protein